MRELHRARFVAAKHCRAFRRADPYARYRLRADKRATILGADMPLKKAAL
jgi:hypothetical protein